MVRRLVVGHYRAILVAVLLVVVGLVPLATQSPYYLDVFIRVIINALLGMCFILVLRTGLVNLSVAAFWGIGAYVSAVLVMKLGVSFWAALPATAMITGVIGLVVGSVIISSGWLGFIVLTAVLGMLFSVTVGSIGYLGAYSGLNNIPAPDSIKLPGIPAIVFHSKIPYFYLAVILAIVVILVCKACYSSSVGRAWRAVRSNTRLAKSLGIDVFRYRLAAFVVCCVLLGLIGSFYAHYTRYISPDTYPMSASIKVQMYAVLGGFGYSVAGPLVGAFLMTLVPELMQGAREYANLFIGAIIILLMLFLPGGLLSLWPEHIRGSRAARFVGRRVGGLRRRVVRKDASVGQ
jgi:branched-chain amino acid transport system permease protein